MMVVDPINTLHADLGHVRTANGTATASKLFHDEEQTGGKGSKEEPEKHGASLDLAAAFFIVVGTENDVVACFAPLRTGNSVRNSIHSDTWLGNRGKR